MGKNNGTAECLRPGCKRTQSARGLCHCCYNSASILVRDGVTTWDALVAAGKCLNGNRSKSSAIKEWLLSPVQVKP